MRGLINYFASNKLIVNVFILIVFVGGFFVASNLKRETYPNVDLKQVNINTIYPGAAPLDVELNVTKKIEDELATVNGLEKYISVSSENMSMIRVWIDMNEKDVAYIKDEIRNAVDRAEVDFPSQAEKPSVVEIKTDIMPVLHYLITSDSLSEKELREIADNMENELEEVKGVSSVKKSAYRDIEYKVLADMNQMKVKDVSLEEIKNAIKGYNIRSGGGSLQSLTNQKNIVTMSQFKNVDEIKNVIIRSNFEGQKVRITDIADVEEGLSKREIYARGNSKNGILLIINKKENADIIRTSDLVKEKVKEFYAKINHKYSPKIDPNIIVQKSKTLISQIKTKIENFKNKDELNKKLDEINKYIDENFKNNQISIKIKQRTLELSDRFIESIIKSDKNKTEKNNLINFIKKNRKDITDQVHILKVMDMTTKTRSMLAITANNAIIGFILVFLVLFIALNHKAALWTAFGIPMALLMTFFGMKLLGFSINVISLFGIITVLGIIVDDGIVVSENIHQKYEQGMSGVKAAVLGAYEMLIPIIGAIATTILAFLPLAMMGGILGEFLYQLPIMVILSLIASLLEVYIALPCHLAHGTETKEKSEGRIIKIVKKGYRIILKKALKLRYLVIVSFILLLIFSFKVLKTMKFELFSNKETDKIYITMEGHQGVSLDEMLERVKKVEKVVTATIPYDIEMEAIVSTVGSKTIRSEVSPNQENYAKIEILLVPFAQRDRIAQEMVTQLSSQFKNKTEIKDLFKTFNIKEEQAGPPVGAPIDVQFISNNEELRKNLSTKLKEILKNTKGVYSIEDDSENLKSEIQLKFNYDEMYRYGVTPAVVASTVRMAFNGEDVTSVSKIKEDIDIVVQLKEKYRYNIPLLKKLLIPTKFQGKQIELGKIADFPDVKTQSKVMRYNGKRTTNITAEIYKDKTSVKETSSCSSQPEPSDINVEPKEVEYV